MSFILLLFANDSYSGIKFELNQNFYIPIRECSTGSFSDCENDPSKKLGTRSNEYPKGTTFELPFSILTLMKEKGGFEQGLENRSFWIDNIPIRKYGDNNQDYFVKVRVYNPVTLETTENYVSIQYLLKDKNDDGSNRTSPIISSLPGQDANYINQRYEELITGSREEESREEESREEESREEESREEGSSEEGKADESNGLSLEGEAGSEIYLRLKRDYPIPLREQLADGHLGAGKSYTYPVGTKFEIPIPVLDKLNESNFETDLTDREFWRSDAIPLRRYEGYDSNRKKGDSAYKDNYQDHFVRIRVLEPELIENGVVIREAKESFNYIAIQYLLADQKLPDGTIAPAPLENLEEQDADYLRERYAYIQEHKEELLAREAMRRRSLSGDDLPDDSVMMVSCVNSKNCPKGVVLRDQLDGRGRISSSKKWESIDSDTKIIISESDLKSTINIKRRSGVAVPFTPAILIKDGKRDEALINFQELSDSNCLKVEEYYGDFDEECEERSGPSFLDATNSAMLDSLRRAITESIVSKTEFEFPVPDYTYISSFFGIRTLRGRRTAPHEGIDIAARRGLPVVAIADGTVIESKTMNGYGKTITIRHDNGAVSRYAHNSELVVKKGQKVKKGQQIAKIGRTGNSTGDHLHFEYRPKGLRGAPVDPLSIFGLDFAERT